MKKFDLLALSGIAAIALFLGVNLSLSAGGKMQDLRVSDLADLSEFEQKISNQKPQDYDQYILAKQWSWGEELHLIENRKYIIHIASSDIQHAFHLEKKALGKSVDILLQPGKIYHIAAQNIGVGVYAIGCTQYCGIEHNKMRGKIIVDK